MNQDEFGHLHLFNLTSQKQLPQSSWNGCEYDDSLMLMDLRLQYGFYVS